MRSRLIAPCLALVIVGVALCVYGPGFDAPMYYDSQRIEQKAAVFAHGGLIETIRIFPQRPLAMASFYLDYSIAGMSARWFRFVNVLLLVATSFLVAVFINIGLKMTAKPGRCPSAVRIPVSAFCGLVFLFHPVQIFVVEYIWQRMALLACLFFMAALVAYVADTARTLKNNRLRLPICFLLFFMAVACKETAVTLPLILFFADIGFRDARYRDLKKTIVFGMFMLLTAAVFASFIERPHGSAAEASGLFNMIGQYYAESGITILQALITQCRMVWLYLQLIVLPMPSQLQLISPQEISQNLLEPVTSIFAVAGVLFLGSCGAYMLYLRRLAGFGILFFLVTLTPEAVLVPQYVFFTYRASMPMIGILCVVADLAAILTGRLEQLPARRIAKTCLAGIAFSALVGLTAVSFMKAHWWADPLRVWGDIVESLPEDLGHIQKDGVAHAFNNLGVALSERGDFDGAVRVHEKALRLIPADQYAFNNIGLAMLSKKEYERAAENFNRAVEVNPYYAEAYYNLGRSFAFMGKTKEAAERFKKTISLDANFRQAYNDLGVIMAQEGRLAEAEELFRVAVSIDPDYEIALQNLMGILTRKAPSKTKTR